ncbi:hypothetical protein predicted by Glimmer/Critica [Sorangium cellulosum So ce56]|uniref:Uncharacterized protein n=1 Tax=Sorangium cellulosum (strain So ce56) TaxID=448385 RepID=A9GDG9_SORC5|nr:hypothetical protein predicted by Glimmer/Critica [Sorangium cellulosum So ce56]
MRRDLRGLLLGVLNAFRHHGGDRQGDADRFVSVVKVLNAFRHHGGDRSGDIDLRVLARHVLNAFRHHGGDRPALQEWIPPPTHVLNAFRHHGGDRLRFLRPQRLGGAVLNAFRHHGGDRVQRRQPDRLVLGQCSTPSGITAGIARSGRATASSCRGAQRLPASRRGSPLVTLGDDDPERVLNAFRHHGGDRA